MNDKIITNVRLRTISRCITCLLNLGIDSINIEDMLFESDNKIFLKENLIATYILNEYDLPIFTFLAPYEKYNELDQNNGLTESTLDKRKLVVLL